MRIASTSASTSRRASASYTAICSCAATTTAVLVAIFAVVLLRRPLPTNSPTPHFGTAPPASSAGIRINNIDDMTLPYIVVVGGSYVGIKTAQSLAETFHAKFRVLLIEKNSHFQHLFAFPRFAVTTKGIDIRKAFIPFNPGTFAACPPGSGKVVQAKVTSIDRQHVRIDRKIALDGSQVDVIPYKYLVLATGTKLVPPGSLPGSEKLDGVAYIEKHAEQIEKSQKIVIIGGGAVGIQMATDVKQLFPEKSVTIVHSRKNVMNRFHSKLHDIIEERAKELGIHLKLGSRVKIPEEGFPTDGREFKVELQDGSSVEADFAVICTGQVPQSSLIEDLSPTSIDEPSKFINTRKTLQIADGNLPNIFVVGDIANSGAPKAARPGIAQAEIVTKNVGHLEDGTELDEYSFGPAAIHLTLGIDKNVIFRNPDKDSDEPMVKMQDNGRLDMGIDDVWKRRGGPGEDYHL